MALAGCRSTETMRQRCVAGDADDCERTCKKGIAGEGGCFHAGELHRVRAELDVKSHEFEKAAHFFAKSCEGKHADGCLFWAQMLEAPYAAPDDANGDAMPALISDKDVLERERRLTLACDLGSAQGCKRLGDVFAGKNAASSLAAYTRACEKSSGSAECTATNQRFVAQLEELRGACTRGDADSCTALGNALFAVDLPRALRLFASESELRGVASIAGTPGRFVRARMSEARRGPGAAPRREPPSAEAEGFAARVERVEGDLALVEAERTLKPYVGWLAECRPAIRADAGEARLRLTVDLSGDVYRAAVEKESLGRAAGDCIARAFENATFKHPMKELTTVELTVDYAAPARR